MVSSYSCKNDPKHQPGWSNTLHQKSSFGTPRGCTKKFTLEKNSIVNYDQTLHFFPNLKRLLKSQSMRPSASSPPTLRKHLSTSAFHSLAQPKTRSLSLAKSPGSWIGFLWLHTWISAAHVDRVTGLPMGYPIISHMKACNPITLSMCSQGMVSSRNGGSKGWPLDFPRSTDKSCSTIEMSGQFLVGLPTSFWRVWSNYWPERHHDFGCLVQVDQHNQHIIYIYISSQTKQSTWFSSDITAPPPNLCKIPIQTKGHWGKKSTRI